MKKFLPETEKQDSISRAKIAAAKAAADLIQDGMRIGIGSGSTVAYFIDFLAERCKNGLHIQALSTSQKSFDRSKNLGIPSLNDESVERLDITVDGADEIDKKKRMVKGGGGALLREKIVANMSQEMIVIVDETKCVLRLGNCPIPLEVLPFGCQATRLRIEQLGYKGVFRKRQKGGLFQTENGNYIFDIYLSEQLNDPEKVHSTLSSIPGVLETGFFFGLAGRVIIGTLNEQVRVE